MKKEIFKKIVYLEEQCRQTGRTTAIAFAAKSVNGGVVVAHDLMSALRIERQFGVKAIPISDLDKLTAGQVPFYDNCTVYMMAQAVDEYSVASRPNTEGIAEVKDPIVFDDMNSLIDSLRAHKKEHGSNIVSKDDVKQLRAGWMCTKTGTWWLIRMANIKKYVNSYNQLLNPEGRAEWAKSL